MPLNGASSPLLHFLQNASLVVLSLALLPFTTSVLVLSLLLSPYTTTTKHIDNRRRWRSSSSSSFRPRTVLVTGVGMSKGLTIARAFYRAGHRVIGADFEPHGAPVCGHFSAAIARFYRLTKPTEAMGTDRYIDELIEIVEEEGVDLWVSCSGVASAIEDGEAAEAVEAKTKCKAIQFGVALTETLHEKHSFISNTRELGLRVPATHLVISPAEALAILHPEHASLKPSAPASKRYIMKSVGLDDSIRADMTILPRPTYHETQVHLSNLRPSEVRPFVLQQFISGPEFCTHSIVIRGRVVAFTACPSAELLMHYKALPVSSALFMAMKEYTETYARKTGVAMTGHFSIDFLIEEKKVNYGSVESVRENMYPIECNPRAHTAVVLFGDIMEDMADAYLRLLPDYESEPSIPDKVRKPSFSDIIVPGSEMGYYWIGHDLVELVIMPVLSVLRFKGTPKAIMVGWTSFLEHVLLWKDGTYEIWDPLPWWWLYQVYWPWMFVYSVWERNWWSRINVSTTKMFGC